MHFGLPLQNFLKIKSSKKFDHNVLFSLFQTTNRDNILSHILIVGALPESLVNFRGDLIRTLVQSGHHVTAMAAPASSQLISQIEDLGAEFHPFPVQRNRLNPWKDLQTFYALYKTFRQTKPDIILAYTVKPVIWGGLAAWLAGNIRFYGLITGLGFAFKGHGFKREALKSIVSWLYRLALLNARRVIFQNPDDLETFVGLHIVPSEKCVIVNGSGVNVEHFTMTPCASGHSTFLLIARLLSEKGIREYAQAARKVKKRYPETTFNLLGPEDPSPVRVPLEEVQGWHNKEIIQYLGTTQDVRPYLTSCHIFTLPSYYGEGLPRTILEAMATGRPILTTDNVGCRETVLPGENGFLVPVRDVDALAECMIWFIEHREEWKKMGKRSREIAEERFDVRIINKELMRIMELEEERKGNCV
jgi:glycosyltransferase involved in cell wall biosynthesis